MYYDIYRNNKYFGRFNLNPDNAMVELRLILADYSDQVANAKITFSERDNVIKITY